MSITTTFTYTVTDIRKTFENFEADLRMIARRTAKWTTDYVEMVFHDIIQLAESEFLLSIDVCLQNSNGQVLRATKFTVNSLGTSITGDRAGGNDWSNIPNTTLFVILSYTKKWHDLSNDQKTNFQKEKDFKISWVPSKIDNTFPHLSQSQGQLYANKGYELRKTNYR